MNSHGTSQRGADYVAPAKGSQKPLLFDGCVAGRFDPAERKFNKAIQAAETKRRRALTALRIRQMVKQAKINRQFDERHRVAFIEYRQGKKS